VLEVAGAIVRRVPTVAKRVPVPERLTRPPSAVSALRFEKRHSISKATQPRALLLAQGLCAEAEHRGYGVALGKDGHHLMITVNGCSYGIKIREQDDRVPQRPRQPNCVRSSRSLRKTRGTPYDMTESDQCNSCGETSGQPWVFKLWVLTSSSGTTRSTGESQ